MRSRSFAVALALALLAASAADATAPSVTLVTPANATGTTYNTRPWLYFYGSGSTYQINNVRVQVCSDSGCSTVVYDRGVGVAPANQSPNRYPAEFYPIPANNSQNIRHRVASALTTGTKYWRVKLWNTGAEESGWSSIWSFSITAVPTWTDNPTVTGGSTRIKASHFNELRTAINNLRSLRASGAYSYTDTLTGGSTRIRAVHMTDLRSALTTPYNTATGSSPSFTDTITGGSSRIRAVHINELRGSGSGGTCTMLQCP